MNCSCQSNHRLPNQKRTFILRSWLCLAVLVILFPLTASGQTPGGEIQDLHKPYDILLQLYVSDTRFDYERMWRNDADIKRLSAYIDTLETLDPAEWPKNRALAYWINLYNAATLELLLQNYPLKSIKDIGGFMRKSPWKRKVAEVAGRELSLDDIENNIIRPQFKDARVHFALNCAAVGCPPLGGRAYVEERLDEQLEAACYFALHDKRWVEITDREIKLSQIFDWYKDDFIEDAGSIRKFIAKYREDDREAILDETRKLIFTDYDWKLNKVGF